MIGSDLPESVATEIGKILTLGRTGRLKRGDSQRYGKPGIRRIFEQSMRRLKGAAIGAGYFSRFQYEAWTRIPEVEITAIYNRTEEKRGP